MNTDKIIETPNIGPEHYRSCLVVLFLAIAICTLPIWGPKIILIGNQIKWQSSGVKNYTLSVGEVGLIRWSEFESRHPTNSFPSEMRADIQVEELFQEAWKCYLFCVTEYDPEYGYPTRVGRFFLEGGWLAISLNVDGNNQDLK